MKIKICYIGGGSKNWARVFMGDLALTKGLSGEIALYDIDIEAAKQNAAIGGFINADKRTNSKFTYKVYDNLETALFGSDFVIISILPGTFSHMKSDVHEPEVYGVYQSVGDTVGPGGVLRAMRTVPIYEGFAAAIQKVCPDAWVINYTNPMSICTKTLYDVFPKIKAFGCCHEVFHAQELLTCVLKELKGIEVTRRDIYTEASGINHFTWIQKARYRNMDLLALLPEFMEKFYEEGYFERGDRFAFKYDPFSYGNKLKLKLFADYGVLAAAGDRHLAEFFPNTWFLKDPKTVKEWQFNLTTVDYRIENQQKSINETKLLASGEKPFDLKKSDEEGVLIMRALMGDGDLITNVNMPNRGQMKQLPIGSVVETNCLFSADTLQPLASEDLPVGVINHVLRNCLNIDCLYEGIKNRDLKTIFNSFLNQPLLATLSLKEAQTLFKSMCLKTYDMLSPYYDIDGYFNDK